MTYAPYLCGPWMHAFVPPEDDSGECLACGLPWSEYEHQGEDAGQD